MTPFAKPISATYVTRRFSDVEPEPVAIIATNDDEFLAVDKDGQIIQGEHFLFTVMDWEVLDRMRVLGS